MGPTEAYIRRECAKLLTEIDQHISDYPIGEKYLCVQAVKTPYVAETLRKGGLVKAKTIDGLRSYMRERAERIDREAEGEE